MEIYLPNYKQKISEWAFSDINLPKIIYIWNLTADTWVFYL